MCRLADVKLEKSTRKWVKPRNGDYVSEIETLTFDGRAKYTFCCSFTQNVHSFKSTVETIR